MLNEITKNEVAEIIANQDAFKWNLLAHGIDFLSAPRIVRGIKANISEILYFGRDIEYTADDEAEIIAKVSEIIEDIDIDAVKAELGLAA